MSRIIDISTDSPVAGLLRVVEWLPQQTCVQIAWLPELAPSVEDEGDWPSFTGTYDSRHDAFRDLSAYLGRSLGEDPEIPELIRNEPRPTFVDMRERITESIRARRFAPPSWCRYQLTSTAWASLDLTGDIERWEEIMAFRSLEGWIARVSAAAADLEDELPELRDELEASSRRFPDSGWFETNRAALELALGHPALAHTAATRATDLLPAYAGAWVYRALAERACQKPHSESLDRARSLRHWEDTCRLRQQFELTPT